MAYYGYTNDQEYTPQRHHVVYDGKRLRKRIGPRKTIDFNSSAFYYHEDRINTRDARDRITIPPRLFFLRRMLPSVALLETPSSSFCTRLVNVSINKVRHPVNVVSWMPEGRRLVTGSSSGELTLWNGLTFNFELVCSLLSYFICSLFTYFVCLCVCVFVCLCVCVFVCLCVCVYVGMASTHKCSTCNCMDTQW
jgi:hypothetical protein